MPLHATLPADDAVVAVPATVALSAEIARVATAALPAKIA
jgi:hypothetical protein